MYYSDCLSMWRTLCISPSCLKTEKLFKFVFLPLLIPKDANKNISASLLSQCCFTAHQYQYDILTFFNYPIFIDYSDIFLSLFIFSVFHLRVKSNQQDKNFDKIIVLISFSNSLLKKLSVVSVVPLVWGDSGRTFFLTVITAVKLGPGFAWSAWPYYKALPTIFGRHWLHRNPYP